MKGRNGRDVSAEARSLTLQRRGKCDDSANHENILAGLASLYSSNSAEKNSPSRTTSQETAGVCDSREESSFHSIDAIKKRYSLFSDSDSSDEEISDNGVDLPDLCWQEYKQDQLTPKSRLRYKRMYKNGKQKERRLKLKRGYSNEDKFLMPRTRKQLQEIPKEEILKPGAIIPGMQLLCVRIAEYCTKENMKMKWKRGSVLNTNKVNVQLA